MIANNIEGTESQCVPSDAAEPVEDFSALASGHDLIQLGDKLDNKRFGRMAHLVGLGAKVEDTYGDVDAVDRDGVRIRPMLLIF